MGFLKKAICFVKGISSIGVEDMSYQSEAALEQQFIEQLNKQGYNPVSIPDYDVLLENFKIQFAAFNAAKLDHPLTDKEWERVFNIMLGKSVFQSAKNPQR